MSKQPTRIPSPRQLEDAMAVLTSVRDRLIRETPDMADDEALLHDMIEGESGDALEVLDAIIRASIEADRMAEAAKERAAAIKERAARYEKRKDTLRGIAFSVLATLDLRRHERPDFTASIRSGQSAVIITDESVIPDRFIRTERKPEKALIAVALNAKEDVPGATLSNSPDFISVRIA